MGYAIKHSTYSHIIFTKHAVRAELPYSISFEGGQEILLQRV